MMVILLFCRRNNNVVERASRHRVIAAHCSDPITHLSRRAELFFYFLKERAGANTSSKINVSRSTFSNCLRNSNTAFAETEYAMAIHFTILRGLRVCHQSSS
jgi:hypothetical protein